MDFVGKYRLERDDRFEDFLKEIGIPYIGRKMVLAMSPIMTITYDAGTESIRIDCEHLRLFNYSISFRLGEEFDEHTFSGETVRTLIEQETAYKLVQEQLTGKHKGLVIQRELVAQDLCKVTCSYNRVTAHRYFRRL